MIKDIIDKYNLASTQISKNNNLYDLDKDLETAAQDATLPQEEKM